MHTMPKKLHLSQKCKKTSLGFFLSLSFLQYLPFLHLHFVNHSLIHSLCDSFMSVLQKHFKTHLDILKEVNHFVLMHRLYLSWLCLVDKTERPKTLFQSGSLYTLNVMCICSEMNSDAFTY